MKPVNALQDGLTVSMMPEGRLVKREEWQANGVGSARPGMSRDRTSIWGHGCAGRLCWHRQGLAQGGAAEGQRPRPTVTVRLGEPMEMVGDDDQANTDAFMTHLGSLVQELEAQRA